MSSSVDSRSICVSVSEHYRNGCSVPHMLNGNHLACSVLNSLVHYPKAAAYLFARSVAIHVGRGDAGMDGTYFPILQGQRTVMPLSVHPL